MRPIALPQVASGMILAQSLYNADGQLLLAEGVEITERYLSALHDWDVQMIYVRDARIPEVKPNEVVSQQIRAQATRKIQEFFGQMPSESTVIARGGLDLGMVLQIAKDLVDAILDARNLSIQLIDLKRHDDYTFSHSVNVCVLGTILGLRLGFTEGALRDLATGLLLHDLGNLMVPSQVLAKPGKLTEDEFRQMSEHARAGFELLKPLELSAHAKIVALQHHEKFDGTGYPKGLKGRDIHINGQIGAIADVYDSLTSDRIYRKRFLPHEAIEYLLGSADRHFSMELVQLFVENIAPYPPGTVVKLSTGEVALVVKVDMALPARPVVRIVQDSSGRALKRASDLDLAKENAITVGKVLE